MFSICKYINNESTGYVEFDNKVTIIEFKNIYANLSK